MTKDGSRPKQPSGAGADETRLPALLRLLAPDAEWAPLDAVMLEARALGLSLPEIHELVRALCATASSLPAVEREALADQIQTAKRQAVSLLLDHISPAALAAVEREALLTVGGLLMDLDDGAQAGAAFERAGDDGRAAQAYGAAGDIERMETCLAREAARRDQHRNLRDLVSRFESLLAGGQRLAAIDLVVGLPADMAEAADLRAAAARIDQRLCRGRTVALRGPDGSVVRFATLPALLGRDGFCQIVLRDAGVSRRHLQLLAQEDGLAVEDAGSRAGTWLCGAQLSCAVRLPERGQLALGEHCHIDFTIREHALLGLTGAAGIDRGLRAFIGTGALPLGAAFPALGTLHILPEQRSARITGAGPVRLAGQLVGPGFDLLHGDVIEAAGQRLEVE